MDTYNKIKQLCTEQNIKLSTLARSTDTPNSVFTELKMGRTKTLSVTTLQKIADYFDVPISYFTDSPTPDSEDKQEELFRKRKLLFDMSGKASAEDLDKIIRMVDALIGE